MASSNPVMAAVGRLAAAHRHHPEQVPEAKAALAAARLEREILRATDPEDPGHEPITTEDRRRLVRLLRG